MNEHSIGSMAKCSFDEDLMIMMMVIFLCVVWLTNERHLVLFPAGTIVRDPHHRKSPTRHKQDLKNAQNRSSGFVE